MEEESSKKTKFHSPVPFLIRFRNFIFGKQKPDVYTRITFFINLAITLMFLTWNIAGYFAISSRKVILEVKGIQVDEILHERGLELGFEGSNFVDRLETVYGIGIVCWLVVFFGLILLYRKKKRFIHFILGGTIFYTGLQIFYLSFSFFMQDITNFDKLMLLILVALSVLHAFLMKNERQGGSISFFGEVEDDE